jgi:hypothetical protein
VLRTGGHQREQGVKDLQPLLNFTCTKAFDAAMKGSHSLADDLAFGLGQK